MAPLGGHSITNLDEDDVDVEIIDGDMPVEEKRELLRQIGILTEDEEEIDLDQAIRDHTLQVRDIHHSATLISNICVELRVFYRP